MLDVTACKLSAIETAITPPSKHIQIQAAGPKGDR